MVRFVELLVISSIPIARTGVAVFTKDSFAVGLDLNARPHEQFVDAVGIALLVFIHRLYIIK
jgi:hypothetical protein